MKFWVLRLSVFQYDTPPECISTQKKTQKCWWLEHGWKTTIKEFPNIPPGTCPRPSSNTVWKNFFDVSQQRLYTLTWNLKIPPKRKRTNTYKPLVLGGVHVFFGGVKNPFNIPFVRVRKTPKPPHLTADTLPSSRLEKKRDNGDDADFNVNHWTNTWRNPFPLRIHGTGIFYLHEWLIFMVNVG